MKTPLEDKVMAHFGRTLIKDVRDHQVLNWTLHIINEIDSGNPEYVDLGTEALGRFFWLLPQIIDSTIHQFLSMIEDGKETGISLSVNAGEDRYSDINEAETSLTDALIWWILAFAKERHMLDNSTVPPKAAVLRFAKPEISPDELKGEMVSISMEYMQERCYSHQDIVAKQRAAYEEMREGKREQIAEEHNAIARESLIAGNVPEAEAAEIEKVSREALERLGATTPTQIPWATHKHLEHPALSRFAGLLISEVRDFAIHDWDMILNGAMRSILAGDTRSRFQSLTPAAQAFVHDLTPRIVDTTLHFTMMLLQQSNFNGIRIMVTLEDGRTFPSLDSLSDGLAGDLIDWIPAFSKQRIPPSSYRSP